MWIGLAVDAGRSRGWCFLRRRHIGKELLGGRRDRGSALRRRCRGRRRRGGSGGGRAAQGGCCGRRWRGIGCRAVLVMFGTGLDQRDGDRGDGQERDGGEQIPCLEPGGSGNPVHRCTDQDGDQDAEHDEHDLPCRHSRFLTFLLVGGGRIPPTCSPRTRWRSGVRYMRCEFPEVSMIFGSPP
ncbi:hypothetical protein C5E51_34435 [Nocardia nova]|nr:hypothetical protein C5E51_34435 [Nocardia nova]